MRRILALSLLFLGLGAATAAAQPCGPLTFSTATNGAGCAPFGGTVPTLTAALGPVAPGACPVTFTMVAGPSPVPLPILNLAVLAIGVADPMLNLAPFLVGCTLRADLDVILAMAGAGPTYAVMVTVPPDPAFVGATVYTQAGVALVPLIGALNIRLSNGLAVSF
jgi:hypothetical protein